MAAGNNRNSRSGSAPKRTPRVAGRNAPRVTVAKGEIDETATTAVDTTTTSGDKTEATTRATSGVERKRRAAAEAKAAEAERKAVEEPGAPPRDTAATYRLAAIIGACAVALGVVATFFAFHPGAQVTDNRAFVDSSESDAVLAQARTSVCTSFNYDYNNLDKWAGEVRSKFTGKALDEYEKFLKVNKSILQQAQSSSDCQVDVIGLQHLNGDSATVVTTMIVSTSTQGQIRKEVAVGQFDFEKVDDKWLVNSVGSL